MIDLTLIAAVLMAGGALVLVLHGRAYTRSAPPRPAPRQIADAGRYHESPYRIG